MEHELARAARRMAARARRFGGRRLPSLWLVTDPNRLADPLAAACRLPRGAGVIHRGFGRPEALVEAQSLARLVAERGLVLLIGLDARRAAEVGAAGVHLPQRAVHLARRIKARRPGWIVTAAAHDIPSLLRAAAAGVDAVLVSPVFPSRSASARGRPALGPLRLARWVRAASVPVIALGGVDAGNVRRLAGTSVAGFAALEAWVRT